MNAALEKGKGFGTPLSKSNLSTPQAGDWYFTKCFGVCRIFLTSNNVYLFELRFLSMLEEEVYGTSSPIWDLEFKPTPGSMPVTTPTETTEEMSETGTGEYKRRNQVLPTMHLLPMGFLYRWSCGVIVMKHTLINRTHQILHFRCVLSLSPHMTTCTKNPTGSNALWDGPDIFSWWILIYYSDWLIDWLVGLSIDQLIDWLIDYEELQSCLDQNQGSIRRLKTWNFSTGLTFMNNIQDASCGGSLGTTLQSPVGEVIKFFFSLLILPCWMTTFTSASEA